MKRLVIALFAAPLVLACEDSGPVPFGDYHVSGGSGGDGGSSGANGSGGYGGSSGYGGGYGGSSGCKGGPGTSCSITSDCCQVDPNGDVCVGNPIYQCAARCSASSDCAGYCCVQLDNGQGACISGGGYPCLP